MQRVSNQDRTERTRRSLIEAARSLFVDKGFAGTSTPEIAEAAGMTRGALYHHFADKQALFAAVVEEEARAVAAEIEHAAPERLEPMAALKAGSRAYLKAMAAPGRTRLLLIEGPSVLGRTAVDAVDEANAARTLREGIEAARGNAEARVSAQVLATLLSAAFDRAALAIEAGGDAESYASALDVMLERVVGH